MWAVPHEDVADRMSIALTLVLTAAAYKFAVSSMTPAISYLTLLDKYVVGCFLIIFLVALEGGVVGMLLNQSSLSVSFQARVGQMDAALFWVLFVTLLALHGAYLQPMLFPNREKNNQANLAIGGVHDTHLV